ncbi:MFS transporter [Brevibacillus sp. GCM10020057]|uniref:MFS transporter n=1 Tax=Brevibacillus sp. GCM10020057 TaxID=3317327 RepID=UPI003636838B
MNAFLALFFSIMFVIGTDTFLIAPLLPALQGLFHISTELSGWMVGAYALGYAVFALIAGPLSDGWNRKTVMLFGMLGFSVATILCGTATGFWSMFLYRFLAGICAAFVSPQVWATIPALFPVPKIAKAMGIAAAGLAVSQAFGVPIGSLLASVHWSYPFFVIGACSLLLAIAIFFAMPDMRPNPGHGEMGPLWKRYLPLWTNCVARGAFLAYFLFQLGNFAAFAFIGKWMTDRFHLSIGQVGYVMMFLGLGNLLGSMTSAYVLSAISRFRAMLAGLVFLACCFVVLPYLPSVSVVAGAYFLIFTLLGILFPLMMGLLTSLNPAIRGTISSLANSVMYAATTLGSWIAGLLYAAFRGFFAVAVFTAVCFVAALAAFIASGALRMQEKPKRELAP